MKADKIRNMDAADLQRQVQEAQEQLFRFQFQMGMGQMEGLKKYRALKKDRARMLTVLGEKGRNGEVPTAPTGTTGKSKAGKK
ncbi:MAG: 50S ribosomal protein L29 [Acidobacteriaceae bacterium]|nr:50S ribosomal protein L29 [Acidobacteriaceae bacterium]